MGFCQSIILLFNQPIVKFDSLNPAFGCRTIKDQYKKSDTVLDGIHDGAMLSYGRSYVNEINAIIFKVGEIVEAIFYILTLGSGGSGVNNIR